MEEIEIKFLEVDVVSLENKLNEIGAKKVGDFFYKRIVFDFPDYRLDKTGQYLRLRDEGDKITLTHKKQKDFISHEQTTKDVIILENEVIVSNFETTRKILNDVGMIEDQYQENRRTRYVFEDVEIDIDSWPKIPTYLEIEGQSQEKVNEVATLLGFDLEDAVRYSAGGIYERHYGIKLHEYSKVTFDEWVKK